MTTQTDTLDLARRLLPCPMCGGVATDHEGLGEFWVRCVGCKLSTTMFNSRAEAESAWSRRAPALDASAEIERLRARDTAFAEIAREMWNEYQADECCDYRVINGLIERLASVIDKEISADELMAELRVQAYVATQARTDLAQDREELLRQQITTILGDCIGAVSDDERCGIEITGIAEAADAILTISRTALKES